MGGPGWNNSMLVGQERPTESSWMSGGANPAQIWAQGSRLGETSKWGLEGASSGGGQGQMGKGVLAMEVSLDFILSGKGRLWRVLFVIVVVVCLMWRKMVTLRMFTLASCSG